MFDIVIKNAQILDGTGAEAFVADVAIQDGKIAKLGKDIPGGSQVIDATGLTLSPGWIDSHSHSDGGFLTYPDQKEKVEQGVTFSITGQCGSSPAPAVRDEKLVTAGEYLEQVRQVPQGSGAALLIGHGTLRKAVIGTENRSLTAQELEKMKALLAEGLEAGAIGMSLGLTYVPGCYADIGELTALAKVVAAHNGVVAAHIRNEGDTLLESLEEFITVVEQAGCRGVISHFKAMEKPNWHKQKQAIAMVEEANARGADIYMDTYPYSASQTIMTARFIPSRFHPRGTTNVLRLLDDPEFCERIKAWGREKWGDDLSWVLVTDCPEHREYQGLDMNQVAQMRGQTDRYQAALDLIRECNGNVWACYFLVCEENLKTVLSQPRTMIGTDSGVAGTKTQFHPRLRGSFPRALGKYVRREGVTTLPEMIRRMTSLPADVYGLAGKGRIAVGYDGDICIFNPATIDDQADYVNCNAPNTGLRYVLVGGKIVAEDGVFNGVRAAGIL